ncbi:venom serine protease-like [Cimex lectularius]|uniref:Peptidase S1 domain-containing protein n=1 Tax=Cimex lectularius TaxID=79782 RepID=A0A8I6RPE3_CIMLE|nr:venom serine protease-like [Cimex lectularius]
MKLAAVVIFSILSLSLKVCSDDSKSADNAQFCHCGWTNKYRTRILGGVETRPDEWPMMAGILLMPEMQHLCGGTIISRHHVLTAAHCLSDKMRKEIRHERIGVVVGVHNYTQIKPDRVLRIRLLVLHPEYTFGKASPDLAILLIDTPLGDGKTVGPVCFSKRRVNPIHKKFKHLGWGVVSNKSNRTSDVLKMTTLKSVDLRSCQYGDLIARKNPFQICTKQRGTSMCFGDSGGPLMWLDPSTGRYSLIGVASFARDNCLEASVSIEVYHFISWIKYVTSAIYIDNHLCINSKI